MRKGLYIACAALAALAACKRTESGDVVVERPGEVDIKTRPDTLQLPKSLQIDLGVKRDTVIFDRPTVKVNRDSARTRDSAKKAKKDTR